MQFGDYLTTDLVFAVFVLRRCEQFKSIGGFNILSAFPKYGIGHFVPFRWTWVAHATDGLRRERGVQTEGKIDGGHSRLRRASGDRLFFLKRAEGLAPKFLGKGSTPDGQDCSRAWCTRARSEPCSDAPKVHTISYELWGIFGYIFGCLA